MQKSFTLIELLVVTSIIVLLTGFLLPNYRAGDRQLALQRSIHRVAQTLRTAQEMAMSSKEFLGSVPAGYGIYFDDSQPGQYILFADADGGQDYDSGEEVEVATLESGVEINTLSPSSPLTILFMPPDPTIVFYPDAASVSITIEMTRALEEGVAYQYTYSGWRYYWSWPYPYASCDNDPTIRDCQPLDPFSAAPDGPSLVLDRWQTCPKSYCRRADDYSKEAITIMLHPQKTIQANKAGLIFVE